MTMKLFKDGGSCATMMTPYQYVEAHQKGRMRRRLEKSLQYLGEKWVMHPLNRNGWNYRPEDHV